MSQSRGVVIKPSLLGVIATGVLVGAVAFSGLGRPHGEGASTRPSESSRSPYVVTACLRWTMPDIEGHAWVDWSYRKVRSSGFERLQPKHIRHYDDGSMWCLGWRVQDVSPTTINQWLPFDRSDTVRIEMQVRDHAVLIASIEVKTANFKGFVALKQSEGLGSVACTLRGDALPGKHCA